MKNSKRFLAVLTATTVALAPTIALAADSLDTDTPQIGGSYIEGVVPGDVYSVVLPTTTDVTYDFILDPANLLKRYDANKDNYTQSSVYFANAGSTTTYSNTSDVATAVNKSTAGVLLTVTATATNVETNPVTFTKFADVEADTKTNVALAIVPATKGTVAESQTPTAGTPTAAQKIEFDSTGKATATFYLAADSNNFEVKQSADSNATSGHKYEYTAKSDATWNTAGFALSGVCNTTADWSAFNTASQVKDGGENISLSVVYKMTKLTDAQKEQMTRTTDPVAADATTGLITFEAEAPVPVAPSIASNTVMTYTVAAGGQITVDLGSGDKKATGITSAIMEISGGSTYDATSLVTLDGTTLKLASNNFAGPAVGTERKVTVTFNDSNNTTAEFTWKKAQ